MLNSHMWQVATVSDRTVLDAGNKAANNKDKVPVFVVFSFYLSEDTERYKNNKQGKNHMILNALKKVKRLIRQKMLRGGSALQM